MSRERVFSRGQTNAIDAVLAIVIFAIIIAVFLSFWANGTSSVKGMLQKNRLEYAALAVSDMLVKSPGLPFDWEKNVSSVQEIGLASGENALSREKLSAFANVSYADAKKLLGVDSDFFFYVEDRNGSRIYEAGSGAIGRKTSVSLTRFAILDGKEVRVRLDVYG